MSEEHDHKMAHCAYCKDITMHDIVDPTKNAEGTGGDLRCHKCGSSRIDTIQGFDADLM